MSEQQDRAEPWGTFFDMCADCRVRTHCAHNKRCLAQCVPADLLSAAQETALDVAGRPDHVTPSPKIRAVTGSGLPGTPERRFDTVALLRRIVIAHDTDDDMDFLAAIRLARKKSGLKLADDEEDAIERETMQVNGYTDDGEPAR